MLPSKQPTKFRIVYLDKIKNSSVIKRARYINPNEFYDVTQGTTVGDSKLYILYWGPKGKCENWFQGAQSTLLEIDVKGNQKERVFPDFICGELEGLTYHNGNLYSLEKYKGLVRLVYN